MGCIIWVYFVKTDCSKDTTIDVHNGFAELDNISDL